MKTIEDVFACAKAEGVRLRLDGTEIQVRRPKTGRAGRKRFVSGKKRQNTEKAAVLSDGQGRLLWCGAIRPDACTTSPRSAPRASKSNCAGTPASNSKSTPATRA